MSLVAGGVKRVVPAIEPAIGTALAWLTSAAGAGAVAGGWVGSPLASDARALRGRFVATGLAGAAATALLGTADTLPVAALVCAAIGFFATLTGVGCQSLLQLVVDDACRGRVLSLWTMAGFGGAVPGTLALGGLGDRSGLGATLIVLGGAGVGAFALLGRVDRRGTA